MKRSLQTGLVGILLAVAGIPAHAQDAVIEGPGVALGEGAVFHPSISLETGVISNVFYEDGNLENNDPVAAGIMRLIGGFSIASQSHQPAGEVEPAIATEDEVEE